MAKSYQNHFRKLQCESFMKELFEVYAFCGSKYSSSDMNIINRIKNSLVKAINNHGKFPKFIVLVLDMDLAEYLGFTGQGLVSLLGEFVEWLVGKFAQLISDRLSVLPTRAKKPGYPQLYWVAPPHHKNFLNNGDRTKMTNCLESTFKLHADVCLIRMKEVWDYDNLELVDQNGLITHSGLTTYWRSVDAAVCFNAKKRDYFLA